MQKKPTPQSITLESVMTKLEKLEQLFSAAQKPPEDELLTPTEVCKTLKISRTQFERMRKNGFINVISPYGKGKRQYVNRAEVLQHFRNEFVPT